MKSDECKCCRCCKLHHDLNNDGKCDGWCTRRPDGSVDCDCED